MIIDISTISNNWQRLVPVCGLLRRVSRSHNWLATNKRAMALAILEGAEEIFLSIHH